MAIHRYRFHRSIASSSRSMARLSGFWQDQPRSARSRPTCARWNRTLNSRSITFAIRSVVHRSVLYPQARVPRSRRAGSLLSCAGLSLAGRPGAGLAFSADAPFRRTASRQRMTELCEQPSRRATPLMDRPVFSRSIARQRRFSNSAGLPSGRMGQMVPPLPFHVYYLCSGK